jgi:hypothetical protein
MESTENNGKKSKGIGKFFWSLLMIVFLLLGTILIAALMFSGDLESGDDAIGVLALAIVFSILWIILVFAIPYFRKIRTLKWFAFLAFLDILWFGYLIFQTAN